MSRQLFLLGLIASMSAFAQSSGIPTFELERLRLNPGARDGLVIGAGDLLERGGYRVSLTGHFELNPLVFRDENGNRIATVVGNRYTAHLAGAWSPFNWLEVGAQVPVVVYQGRARELDAIDVTKPDTTALGTPYVHARFGLLRQSDGNPVDLALGVAVGLPLGSASALTRDPTVSGFPSVAMGHAFKHLRLGAELGASIRGVQTLSPDNPDARNTFGSMLEVGVGITTLGRPFRGEVSIRSSIPFTRLPAAGELLAGARYTFGPGIELYALVGGGIGRLPGTPVFRALLGLAFGGGKPTPPPAPAKTPAPPPPESPKCAVGQAHTPEECPDLDFDGDGIKNRADRCPKEQGSFEAFGCPDADRDGVVDATDRCPAVRGHPSLAGCPDTDGDGIADPSDKCPTDFGPPERQGCPVVDTDGDSVADEVDNCPKVAGVVENQGCPKAVQQLVIITRDKLVIKDKVYFDTAKSKIQKRSFGLLNQVARILVEHPDVSQVTVEGHTDNQGKAEMNRKLSQARAESVRAYLIKQGVEPDRLLAKGYGPDRPVATNNTAAGREQNRRVEFAISTEEKVETKPIEVPR